MRPRREIRRTSTRRAEPAPAVPASTEKIQKVLARAGYGSRRRIEAWIAAGRVTVNSRPARLGDRVGPRDRIVLDGRPVAATRTAPRPARVIAYHKPAGEICTRRDPQGRPTVFDALPRLRGRRWVAVGRLDLNTSGLLLLTDDGELAQRLAHPSRGLEREYAVRVLGEVAPGVVERLTAGVELDDGPAAFDRVEPAGGEGANHWYRAVIREGRKREVRRLWESQGVTVSRLIRIRYGPIELGRMLRPGRWRDLSADEIGALLRSAAPGRSGADDAVSTARGARRPAGV